LSSGGSALKRSGLITFSTQFATSHCSQANYPSYFFMK
jgi:hypothetical protein